jgi:hypothetical protein
MHRIVWGSAAASILLSQVAFGATQPETMDLGAFKFVPTVQLSQSLNDNIYLQRNTTVESWITRVAPELELYAESGASRYSVAYIGDYGLYEADSDDDYDDHTLKADVFLDLTTRNRFTIAGSYGMLHDNRGEGASEGFAGTTRPAPDEYDLTNLSGMWDFGAEGNLIGFSVAAAANDIEYQNNRIATQYRDRSDMGYTGRIKGNLTGKTTYFLEYGSKDIEYEILPLFGDSLDSTEAGVFIGAEWDISGKTTGAAKIGRVEKDFDAASRGDDDFTAWEVGLGWTPRTYSLVNFVASRLPQETNGTGSFIEATNYVLSWDHSVSENAHFTLGVNYGEDRFPGSVIPRDDERNAWFAGMNFDLARWINFGFKYTYDERDSTNNQFDYERNVVMFTLDLSL